MAKVHLKLKQTNFILVFHNKCLKTTLFCYIFVSAFDLKYILTYLTVFICLGIKAQSITSPQIGCVSVLPNGQISVTWQTPPDPLHQFSSYQIYASTVKTGTYTLQGSINTYSTNNSICASISNANTQPYFIYIQTVTSGSLTLQSVDTVRTIFLSVSGTNPSSTPILNWNSIASPLPAGEGTMFDIWRQRTLPGNPWNKIASVPLNANGNINYSYLDSIRGVCSLDSVRYRVELSDPLLGCTSVSNVSLWHTVKDLNPPTIPTLDSVSVVSVGNNQYPTLGISPAYSEDVACFVVYIRPNGGTYTDIDTLCTANTPTTYTDVNVDATTGPQEFSIASLDSCGNIGTIAFNSQKTICATASYTTCGHEITSTIRWTPYINMVTGVNRYEVFCTVGGVTTSIGNTTDTFFSQYNLLPSTTYIYYVRAHSNGHTIAGKDTASSTSSSFNITTSVNIEPTFIYLKNVTVNAQQTIDISWHVLKTDPIGGFNIYRSTSQNSSYSLIKNLPFTTNVGDYSYTDNNVNTHTTAYYYFIDVLDNVCSNPVIRSDTSNSILLNAVPTPNLTATLTWNNYAKYAGSVTGYNIYRSINGSYGNIAFVPTGTTNFVDDLSPYTDKEGMFLYYVEAVEGTPDSLGLQTSQSNFDTVYVDANLYIPNSFVPSSLSGPNKVFLPIGSFIDNSDYILTIYNRWGAKIYSTTDPNQGWDGGGHEEAVYAYTVQYKTSIGEYRQRSGTVNLIR